MSSWEQGSGNCLALNSHLLITVVSAGASYGAGAQQMSNLEDGDHRFNSRQQQSGPESFYNITSYFNFYNKNIL